MMTPENQVSKVTKKITIKKKKKTEHEFNIQEADNSACKGRETVSLLCQ